MANSPVRTIRIKPDSALERLTMDKPSFSAAVHHLAEVLELAMAEEAARAAQIEVTARLPNALLEALPFVESTQPLTYEPRVLVEGGGRIELLDETPVLEALVEVAEGKHAGVSVTFEPKVPGLPPKLEPVTWDNAQQEITDDATVLAAVAAQVPAGLEPVAVVHEALEDETHNGLFVVLNEDDEDLSDLI